MDSQQQYIPRRRHSSQSPPSPKFWFIDGVSCLGKTSFIKNSSQPHLDIGLPMDYAERSKQHPFFLTKHSLHTVQVMYTASFCLTLMDHVAKLAPQQILYVDRSPISDIWYELLFKSYDDEDAYETAFRQLEQLDMFRWLPTIFVVPHETHAETIVKQMSVRGNGVDSTERDYVLKQIRVFSRVAKRFGEHPNVRVISISADRQLYTPEYFAWLSDQIRAYSRNDTSITSITENCTSCDGCNGNDQCNSNCSESCLHEW